MNNLIEQFLKEGGSGVEVKRHASGSTVPFHAAKFHNTPGDEADHYSKEADKLNTKAAHGAASDAHQKAAAHYDRAGDRQSADYHDKRAREHSAIYGRLTESILTEGKVVKSHDIKNGADLHIGHTIDHPEGKITITGMHLHVPPVGEHQVHVHYDYETKDGRKGSSSNTVHDFLRNYAK